jgi:hypothetical protein
MPTVRLSRQEVEKAIFLDYEGNIGKPPTLLGWRMDDETDGGIVEAGFATCAEKYRARHVVTIDHKRTILKLIARAISDDRRIVTWSLHDFHQMEQVLSKSQVAKLRLVYRNALDTARPWYRHKFGQTAKSATLSHFFELAGFHVPERFGPGIVGLGLRLIRAQLSEGRNYSELTQKARATWVAIVKHNKYDLEGMEKVLRHVVPG